jgi:molybdopterin/thiamine biosynthesis adenylyltransferase/rhodanese-related sulfurtransferase
VSGGEAGLQPLVEPADDLSREELARYARHLTLAEIGPLGQRRLKAARVLVVGAGGLGSPALQYLAAAGVGTLGIVDDDAVDLGNLQRQVIHRAADIGRPKAESAADAVRALNPLVDVRAHRVRLTAENALELVRGYDLVLDGADNFATRYLVSDACALAGIPCVWGSILRFEGRVSVFWAGRGPTYRDLHPEPPPAGEIPSCAEGGVLGMLPGMIGTVMVAEAVKLLTGTGSPLVGRVLMLDALTMRWRELRLDPDPLAPEITEVAGLPAEACGNPGTGPAAACGPTGPTAAETVSPQALSALLDLRESGGASFGLVDVREEWERALVSIPGAVGVELAAIEARGTDALPEELRRCPLVLHCKSGARSARALELLRPHWRDREETLRHLSGGVLAWIDEVDPALPRY